MTAQPAKPTRQKPAKSDGPCPIMRTCGGCEWLNLPYKKQLARKQEAMDELFSPLIERFAWSAAVQPIVPMGALPGEPPAAEGRLASPRAFRYKAATPYAPSPHGRSIRCGFYARGTHEIVPCAACAVEAPGARHILNEVAGVAMRLRIPAYQEDRQSGILRHAIVRMGWRTSEALLTVVTSQELIPRQQEFVAALQGIDPRIVCVAQNINPLRTNAMLGGRTRILAGNPTMRDELLGCSFEISPTAFYQTNPAQTEVLYRLAIDGMALEDGDVLLDAYCGSGTIGICATRAAAEHNLTVQVLGIERNIEGVRDARRNAQLNDMEDSCRFICDDATRHLQRAVEESQPANVVVLDPPRAGATEEFLLAASALEPRRIVYISCNPTTQARDLEVLGAAGWRLLRLAPVDMFPHTSHVETVAVLTR